MFDLTEEQIETILTRYKNQQQRDKDKYEKVKDSEEFKMKNREKAKLWYDNNKEKRAKKYQDNKDFMSAKNTYYYYKRTDQIDKFKQKHPQKYDILSMYGYFND